MIEITLFHAKTRESPFACRGYRIGSCTIAYHALTLTGELFRDRPGSCESGISTSRQGGKACRPTVVTVARQLIVPQQPLPACFSWPSDESGRTPGGSGGFHALLLSVFVCGRRLACPCPFFSGIPAPGVFTCAFRLSPYGRGFLSFARPSRGAPSSDCAFLLTNAAVNRRSSLAVPFSGLLTQRCMRLRSVAASFYQ